MAGHWAFLGYGGFIVEERNAGRVIGQVGCQQFLSCIDPAREDLPEVGWVLAKNAHGLGYATQAVSALMAWADLELSFVSTVAIIHQENSAPLALARTTGYREIDRAVYNGPIIMVLESARGG